MARLIRQGNEHSRTESRSLLQAIFVAEMIQPSAEFWIASPWISDIPVLDNRGLTFDLQQQWGPAEITLSQVLVAMARNGSHVSVVTTKDPKNVNFLARLEAERIRRGVVAGIRVIFDDGEQLHEKAMVGEDFVIDGSMNFTFYGLQIRRERVNFETDKATVAAVRTEMREDFGGLHD